MKNQWYGDNRDLVKWGVLLHLAHDYGAEEIIQVAYSRPSIWNKLEIDGKERRLPAAVVNHFRDVCNAAKLVPGPKIQVLSATFSDRRIYMRKILKAIADCQSKSRIIFLDPDTGLAPRNPNLTHVLDAELSEIWQHMRDGDVLAFYQHQTNRNGTPWIEPKRKQFEVALHLPKGVAKVAQGPKIARDVVFFYCQKRIAFCGGLRRKKTGRK